MGRVESTPESLSSIIAFNREVAGMEADLAVVAAGAIGSAEVDIQVDIDEDRIYPASSTHLSIRRKSNNKGELDPENNVPNVVFHYTRGNGGNGKARLKQSTVTHNDLVVINDFVALDPSAGNPFVRYREVRTRTPWMEATQVITKHASSRTVVAMARLAAFHARADHENSRNI